MCVEGKEISRSEVRFCLTGLKGRMEQLIVSEASLNSQFQHQIGIDTSEVIIDFSSEETTLKAIEWSKTYQLPLVVGTTGLSDKTTEMLADLSKTQAVLFDSNMSVGIALIKRAINDASKLLGLDFDIEIIETHHRRKKDAPSGTALSLAKEIQNAKKSLSSDHNYHIITNRSHQKVARNVFEIGIQSVRAGSISGDHRVLFCSDDEQVEFSHQAFHPRIFAKGALMSALFVLQKKREGLNGLYTLLDVLDWRKNESTNK